VQAQQDSPPAEHPGNGEPSELAQPGFGARGRTRRRARFLRRARELAYRDLGGLVYNLHRFGQRNDPLVLAKLHMLGRIDAELRALEGALNERQPVTVLREAGITACPRCAAIHGSEDHFCPNCGLSAGRHVDLPIAGAASTAAVVPAPAPVTAQAASPPLAQAPLPPQAPSPPPPQAPVAATAPTPPATQVAAPVRAPAPTQAEPTQTPPERPVEEEATEIIHPSPAGQ